MYFAPGSIWGKTLVSDAAANTVVGAAPDEVVDAAEPPELLALTLAELLVEESLPHAAVIHGSAIAPIIAKSLIQARRLVRMRRLCTRGRLAPARTGRQLRTDRATG